MKTSKFLISCLTALMMIGNVPIMAQDTGENGISEEGKAYLESEEYQKRIKEKEEWMARQPMKLSAGRMNITHYFQGTGNNWCGPAAGKMVIEYINGSSPSLATLASEMETDDGKVGTFVNDVQASIAYYTGVPYEVSDVAYGNFYNNVKTDFDADFPVIYDVDVYVLDKSYDPNTGHYLVGAGYSSSGQLYYSDPGRTSNYEKTVSQSSMISALEGNGGYYIY